MPEEEDLQIFPNLQYMGSFAVARSDQAARAEYVRAQLRQLKCCSKSKPVLLVVSLAGVKVCSLDGKKVHMAHALRRISYATCDPKFAFFSFLAREPKGHCSLQYCHSFRAKSAQQAEQLNSLVGNAFRMAYAAQLQRQPSPFSELLAVPGNNKQSRNCWTRSVSDSNSATSSSVAASLSGPPKAAVGSPVSDEAPASHSDKRVTEPASFTRPASAGGFENEPAESARHIEIEANRLCPGYTRPADGGASADEQVFRAKRSSQTSSGSSASSGALPVEGSSRGASPPPPPERSDSLRTEEEERALHAAPWFQAGIPREIALEVLSQEPVGAFMVRESTSKPGCYALSLRVPQDFQLSGIAHYLIMRTHKGYKIKGFTKEFGTLMALITHHSVMPELLPCPLSLSRYNPSFVKTDEDTSQDFSDVESDPDYDTLADFRKMMADLNV